MSKPLTSIDDFVNLSNDDVKLLYDIVSTAEQSKSPPYRALFNAHEQILAERGISKEEDQTYLRFLLRMGEGAKEGQSLFERFESLLAKLGIKVAFDAEGSQAETASAGTSGNEPGSPSIRHLQTRSFRPARQASSDVAVETRDSLERLELLPPRPQSSNGQNPRSKHDPPTPYPQKIKSALRQPAVSEDAIVRGRLVNESSNIPTHVLRSVSAPESALSSLDAPHKARIDDHLGSEGSGFQSDDENELTDPDATVPTLQEALAEPPAMPTSQPGEMQLNTYANTLRFHHVAAKAVSIFRNWRAVTEASRNQHDVMAQSATVRDATLLKRQAFDQWRIAMDEEAEIRETENFYQNLEMRATKARDLFLITKAFTHWAQCASEEVLRKSAARRHILRAKYFNAWRDITVVNELKVRRQRLKKMMKIWKGKTKQTMILQDQANDFRLAHAANNAYRSWFWHFCDRRAPTWYTTKLKRTLFSKWLDATRVAINRKYWALDFRCLELVRRCVSRWTAGSDIVQNKTLQAIRFRRQKLIHGTLEVWQRETRLSPLQTQLSNQIDHRTKYLALNAWIGKIGNMSQAHRINELRLKLNAWTYWNDSLRCNTLRRTMNDRILVQTLYKWVLAQRLALCERVAKEKLLTSIFSSWRGRTNELCSSLGSSRYQVRMAVERRKKTSLVKTWSDKAQLRNEEHARAQKFRDHQVMTETLETWIRRYKHVQTTQTWSRDARFFVLSTRTLKDWHAAAVELKKSKRKNAYAKIRRRLKTAMATAVMVKWREATIARDGIRRRDEEASRQRVAQVSRALLQNWHAWSTAVQAASVQADFLYETRISRDTLRIMSLQIRQVRACSLQARDFLSESRQASAATCLRKISWQVFQLKRLRDTGESLEERNRRKHFRSMLRHWADSVSSKRPPRETETLENRPAFEVSSQGGLSTIPQTEQWTPFPNRQSLAASTTLFVRPSAQTIPQLETSQPMATPAYLRTPSRHLSKARSMRPSSTTDPPQQSTRFTTQQPADAIVHPPRTVQVSRTSARTHWRSTAPLLTTTFESPATPQQAYTQPLPQGRRPQLENQQAPQITPFMHRLRAQYAIPASSASQTGLLGAPADSRLPRLNAERGATSLRKAWSDRHVGNIEQHEAASSEHDDEHIALSLQKGDD